MKLLKFLTADFLIDGYNNTYPLKCIFLSLEELNTSLFIILVSDSVTTICRLSMQLFLL